MSFASTLSALMKERGWSNYRLAKMMDCAQSTVGHWIAGDTMPQRSTVRRLAEVFGVSVDVLLENEKPTALGDGLTQQQRDLIRVISLLPNDVVSFLLSASKEWLDSHKGADGV